MSGAPESHGAILRSIFPDNSLFIKCVSCSRQIVANGEDVPLIASSKCCSRILDPPGEDPLGKASRTLITASVLTTRGGGILSDQ